MKFLACPGQGSQTPGFLIPWLAEVPGFEAELSALSQACGKDLIQLGTEADEETIKDTANSQPLIVGASIAAARTAIKDLEIQGVVGHSVGEFAAAAISGVLSDADAIKLVGIRAEAMAKAAAEVHTSMAAVLGGEESDVLRAIESFGLSAANFNGAGQIVAAGPKAQISQLVASPPDKARVIELKVAGAFHTDFMLSAQQELAQAASAVAVADPKIKLYSNQAGQLISSGQDFLDLMVGQVSKPVRWDRCMTSLDALGIELIELPPAGALAGLAKRGMPNSSAVALKSPADLEKIGA
jgi:[acyl-carrier-protein] S-malonyltransferase